MDHAKTVSAGAGVGAETIVPAPAAAAAATLELEPIVITAESSVDHPRALIFENTLKRNGWSCQFVGRGKPWTGFATRMQWYAEALRAQPASRIVVLSDARDVFCLRGSRAFIDAFRSFRTNMVVSMEMFSMGHLTFLAGFQCADLSVYWRHWRVQRERRPVRQFVNGGLVAGTAGQLLHWLDWALAKEYTDDQLALGEYMNAFPAVVATDTEATFLHTSGSGVCAGIVDQAQVADSPTLLELAGRGAFFLHIPGAGSAKGQNLMYEMVERVDPPAMQDTLLKLYTGTRNVEWRRVVDIC